MNEPSQSEPSQTKGIPPAHQYHYETLRDEALALTNETRKIEQQSLIAVSALYAWLATHRAESPDLIWFLGLPIALLAGLRCRTLGRRIQKIADYLIEIEEVSFNDPKLPGWERFLAADKSNRLTPNAERVWKVMIFATILVPIIAFFFKPTPPPPAPIIQVIGTNSSVPPTPVTK